MGPAYSVQLYRRGHKVLDRPADLELDETAIPNPEGR